MKVWIVMQDDFATVDDAWSSISKVFSTEEKAQAYADEMNTDAPEGTEFCPSEWEVE